VSSVAFTTVYNDMVILEFWCKYYSRYFDELVVLCYGTKEIYNDKLAEFGEKYRLRTVRFEVIEQEPIVATRTIREKQCELLENHEWVLRADCDEIVATRPDKYKDLKDFMEKCKKDWVWSVAYEILQEDDEPWLDYSKPILRQRRSWLKNPAMNKVLISRVPLSWNDGQHQIEETKNIPITTMKNYGLYLLHFKHADYGAPNRDLVPNLRPKFVYVEENWEHRGPIPEELRDLL